MSLHVEDIIPMDKGSAGSTEYKYNKKSFNTEGFEDRHIDYINETMEKNPEVLNWKIGHIHSHASMNVFFSGTDMSELETNAKSHNFYLSLVVNNKLETVAKVITYAEAQNTIDAIFMAKDENGKSYPISKQKLNFKKGSTKVYNCEIIKEEQHIRVDSRFIKFVDEIIKEKEISRVYRQPDNQYNSDWNGGWSPYTDRNTTVPLYKDNLYTNRKETFPVKNKFQEPEFEFEDKEFKTRVEDFIKFLFNNGDLYEEIDLEDLFIFIEDDIASNKIEIYDAKDFITDYPNNFIEYFPEFSEDEDIFMEVLKQVIEVFSEYEIDYNFIKPLNRALKRFAINFVKSNKV